MLRRATVMLKGRTTAKARPKRFIFAATIARRHGDFTAAFAYLDRAIELSEERSAVRAKCGNTRGDACWRWANGLKRSANSALHCNWPRSGATSNTRAGLFITSHCHCHDARGFGEALRWLRRPLRDERNTAPMPQEADAYFNVARLHLYRGEFEMCEQHLDRAMERCQLFNMIGMRAQVFETYGMLYREIGGVARAREFYERAARDYDKAGIELALCELLDEQALLELQIGDLAAARKLIDQLINARRNLNDELRNQTAALTLGRILIAQGEEESARAELDSALGYFRQNGLYYYEAQACIALAQCDFAAGRDVQMLERLRRALDLAARYDYEYWLRRN